MFAFRCTKVLTKKLGLPVTAEPPPPTTKLGDWYGNVLNIGHLRLMIFVSDSSLLPVIMPLKERHQLLHIFKERLAYLLVRLDVDAHLISAELNQMQSVIIAPTANRSVLGSMNEFIFMTRAYFDMEEYIDLTEIELWLAETLCKPKDYESPQRLVRKLMSAT